MAGYIGSKAVNLSTTGADINGNANVDGTLDVTGAFTSLGIDDNATSTAMTLDASGNVGIGTTPSAKLDVSGGYSGVLRLKHNYSFSQPNWAIKIDGEVGTPAGYLSQSGASGGFFLASGGVYYGGGNYKADANATSFCSIQAASDTITFSNASGLTGGQVFSGAETMRIDASGNVGIGTAAPSYPLDIQADVQGLEVSGRIRNNDALSEFSHAQLRLETPYNNASISSYTGAGGVGYLTFDNMGAERMRVDASGNVLVGKTAVSNGVNGTEVFSQGLIRVVSTSADCVNLHRYGTDGTAILFLKATSNVGSISITGSATAYNTSSDYRLKENITPVQGAADIVKTMQPVTYTFKSDGSWHDGFLAHELQELHPRAVIGEKDAMKDEEYEVTPEVYEDIIIPAVEAVAEVPAVYDDEGVLVSEMVPAVEAEAERTEQQLVSEAVMGTRSVPDYQGVDYSKLTPILTAALKEALTKIEVLEAHNATFETRLAALEATP